MFRSNLLADGFAWIIDRPTRIEADDGIRLRWEERVMVMSEF